jgi:hypothetical protein
MQASENKIATKLPQQTIPGIPRQRVEKAHKYSSDSSTFSTTIKHKYYHFQVKTNMLFLHLIYGLTTIHLSKSSYNYKVNQISHLNFKTQQDKCVAGAIK